MREFSGKQISRAGEILTEEDIAQKDPEAFNQAMEILSYWRACHEEPLNLAVDMLLQSAQKYDPKAVIAKRLKRTPSIINKLRRFSGMKLRSMQDIGGCRAILANEKRVRKLVRELKRKKNFKAKDYIDTPKEDGYRSIHLVGDFSNGCGGVRPIELQIRTAAQHSWATAVEIIDLFTKQAIKSNQGSEDWRQFFRSAGNQFALIEDIPLYNHITPDRLAGEIVNRLKTPVNLERHKAITQNAESLYVLSQKLEIVEKFNAFANSLKAADTHLTKVSSSGYVLLVINLTLRRVNSTVYSEERFHDAAQAYLEAEKRAAISKEQVVALVSSEAVGGIKEAFPNYFADSTLFMKYIRVSIQAYRNYSPIGIGRAFKKIFS